MRNIMKTLGITVFLIFAGCAPLLAAENQYAKNIGEWVLDGLFWIILVAGIGITGFAIARRNFTGVLITILVTALLLAIVNDPDILVRLGNTLKTIIGL